MPSDGHDARGRLLSGIRSEAEVQSYVIAWLTLHPCGELLEQGTPVRVAVARVLTALL